MTSSSVRTAKLNSQELQFALLKHQKEWNNKNGRRGKIDIMADILLFCEHQKTKTAIMYNANLNYSQLKSQIRALTSQGLLERKLNKYITTKKGNHFLELFAQLNNLMDELKSTKTS